MSKATSGADLSSIDPARRCAHAAYLLDPPEQAASYEMTSRDDKGGCLPN